MAIPKLPWYDQVKDIVAPTERITNMMLILIIAICVVVLIKGNAVTKAAVVVWAVSP